MTECAYLLTPRDELRACMAEMLKLCCATYERNFESDSECTLRRIRAVLCSVRGNGIKHLQRQTNGSKTPYGHTEHRAKRRQKRAQDH